jgi:uncharacterized phage protein (TIGR02216 family)
LIAWNKLLRASVGRLGLKPDEFWDLTPAELLLMLGDQAGCASLSREGMNELMAQFPDGHRENEDCGVK